MNEWQIVVVIIALVGLIVTVTTPIVKLVSSITKLTQIVEVLQKDFNGIVSGNREAHKRLWEHNEEQDEKLGEHDKMFLDHEHRIKDIEKSA